MERTAAEIRQEFIEFFRERGHTFAPSSPVVPHDDPTLLFTNAGMNQFKDVFLATGTRPYTRAANTQKCIRAGGKHNDLDDVGHDTYHHTFFEMLGNWSFGDYFKTEAIDWAWELLTKVWGIDPERLHATYFEGDEREGLERDLEAMELWAHYLPGERIHPGNKKDNFWEMGETGPCGPCSEIHIDLTQDKSGGELVNAGDARVIEIWNLVFIQHNRGGDGKLTPLPAKHVDTGMGLERVAAVLQGHNNNYATDVFVPVIQAIERATGHKYGEGENRHAAIRAGNMPDEACRVIADHVRCLTFALTDGAVPDREGRGYVLRRILRRGVRFGWQYLDLHKPFLCDLVDTVVATMGDAFPELKKDPQRVKDIIREEEESFGRTLDRGIALFEEAAKRAGRHEHHEISGDDAFKLHDTYGFPIDLTQVMAEEKGLRVDIGEYERLMEEARARARAGADAGYLGDFADIPPPDATASCDETPIFDPGLRCEARILTWSTSGSGVPPARPSAGARISFRTSRTCFYAEGGGQVSDTGTVRTDTGIINVVAVTRDAASTVHHGYVVEGHIDVGQQCVMEVDQRRRATMKNHTATHVMNWALREVLGEHVQQKGSLVDHEKTRFDFSHPKALTPEEIERVEQLVSEKIRQNLPIHYKVVPQQEALKINGLRAVFGERYPDEVRVMSIGVLVEDLLARPDNPEWRKYSIEFCGGTHLNNTADIEHFVITTEAAVAKGIRRIVAVTGEMARSAEQTGRELLDEIGRLKAGPPEQVADGLARLQAAIVDPALPWRVRHEARQRIEGLQEVVRQQQKADAASAADVVKQKVSELLASAEKVGQTTVLVGELTDLPIEQLKIGADMAKQKCGSAAVLFGVRSDDKALLLAAMTPDLIKKGLKAGDLVKSVAPIIKGGGGGPPTMAQAGGKDPSQIDKALEAGRAWIIEKLA